MVDTDRVNASRLVWIAIVMAMMSGAVFSILLLFGRWWYQPGGELVQLTLLMGSLTAASLLAIPGNCLGNRRGKLVDRVRFLTAILVATVICAWAPGVTMAILLVSPMAIAVALPEIIKWSKLKIQFVAEAEETSISHEDSWESTSSKSDGALAGQPNDTEDRPAAISSDPQSDPTELAGSVGEESFDWGPAAHHEPPCPFEVARQLFLQDSTTTSYTTRWLADDGTETLLMLVRCQFAVGQKSGVVQLPVWPFFTRIPQVYCEIVDGPEATVKTTDCKKHGLRLDLRIARKPTQPIELIMEIVAIATPSEQGEAVGTDQNPAAERAVAGERTDAAA